jgi:hypothetical protein
MNERIQKLAEQAGVLKEYSFVEGATVWKTDPSIERFAELIVRECKENFGKVWYEQGLDIRGAEFGKFMTRFEEHFGVEE